jgi:hypothetical protein
VIGTPKISKKVRDAWWSLITADIERGIFYQHFREMNTGPVGQGFAIELLPPLEDDAMPRTKTPKSRTAMEQAIPIKHPTATREVDAQRARADMIVELVDPLNCPYCGGLADLLSGQRFTMAGTVAYSCVICRTCNARGSTYLAHGKAGDIGHVRSALETWNRVAGAV